MTPQMAAVQARLPLLVAHAPGHGFITDVRAEDLCVIDARQAVEIARQTEREPA